MKMNEWKELLKEEFNKDYFLSLQNKIHWDYKYKTIYPSEKDLYSALCLTDYHNVKVVILGQDPYHGENQAHGLSFSVKEGMKVPPSLKNIYKELNHDLGCYIPNNGYLKKWATQGVLLLNTVLTVEEGKPNSHKKYGWQTFTDEIIRKLNLSINPIVFILWGNNAISKKSLITNSKHLVLTSVHPSPLSASRGFFGTKPFSKTNDFLLKNYIQPIDWQIENI